MTVLREKIAEVADGLGEMESPLLEVRNLAIAARMMGSSDDMSKDAGLALDVVADAIFEKMTLIIEEQNRLWVLAQEARTGEAA